MILIALAAAGCTGGVQRADAYEALADTLVANKAYPAAIQALTKATKIDSNEPRRWLKLGRAWRSLDNPALCAMSYQRALDLDPANVEALQNLAVLMVRAGRYDDAKQYTGPLLMLSPNDPGGLLASGAIAFYEKRLGDADKIAGQLIQLAPDASDGYVLRGRVLEALGQPGRAASMLQGRLDVDQGNFQLATQLLQLYRRIGDLQGIRRTALVLSSLKPDDITYQFEAARALHAAGREAEARTILGELLAKYPGSPGINSGVADYWIGTLPRAQAIATVVAMGEKVHGRARSALADRLRAFGDPKSALLLLSPEVAAVAVDLKNIDIQASYARALLAAGQIDEAAARAQRIIAVDQNDQAALVQANIALIRHDYTAALMSAQGVRDNDPDNVEAALLIAKIHDAQDNPVLARKAFGDAMSAMPNNLEIIKAFADWLVKHGNRDDAVSVATQFAASHPRMGAARDHARWLCASLKTAACMAAENNTRQPWNL